MYSDRQPRTLGGNYLCQNSVDPDPQIRESSRQPNARVTTRSPVMATEERDSRAAGLLHDGGDVITLTAYMRAKEVDPDGVYNADSMPRGHMLVIDNEYFDSPYIGNRDGTEQDSQILVDLFQNQLRYTVRVARDCSTQRMFEELKNFKKDLAQHQVDSCVVAILSHGGEGDIIFGCDGRVNERGTPVRGTYITTSDLRNFVAYRGRFIQLLVKVFQEHAHKAHIKDMATMMPILNIGKVKNLSVFTAPVNVTYLPDGTVVTTPAQGAVTGAAGGTSLPTPVEVDAAGESADEATASRLVLPGSSGDAGRAPRTGAARYGESGSVQCSEDATHGLGGNANELQQDEGNVQWVNNYWEALGKRPQR
ncbi:hypothetical protein BaRGS_00022701, partial [Batillaria attramentaria]